MITLENLDNICRELGECEVNIKVPSNADLERIKVEIMVSAEPLHFRVLFYDNILTLNHTSGTVVTLTSKRFFEEVKPNKN